MWTLSSSGSYSLIEHTLSVHTTESVLASAQGVHHLKANERKTSSEWM